MAQLLKPGQVPKGTPFYPLSPKRPRMPQSQKTPPGDSPKPPPGSLFPDSLPLQPHMYLKFLSVHFKVFDDPTGMIIVFWFHDTHSTREVR